MENYELLAADVFRAEFDSERTGKDYTQAQKDALNKMANLVEEYYIAKRIPNPIVPGPMHPDYLENQMIYHTKLMDNFEKGEGRYPYFFYTFNNVFTFEVCYEYKVEFGDVNAYSLFLGFKLRNLSLHELDEWLNGLNEKYPYRFLKFLGIHLVEYDYLYDDKRLKFIRDWMAISPKLEEGPREGPATEIEEPQEIVTGKLEDIITEPPRFFEQFNLDVSVVPVLVEILKPYFSEKDIERLPQIFKDEKNEDEEKLYFKSSGNRFAEVFRQLHERKKIISSKNTTCRFICQNFQHLNSKTKSISDFKEKTVYDILTNSDNPVSKQNRIDLSSLWK